ncbi:exosortase A [Sediminicurvatus halobius]|uniref:Exosortase A n=1 Tax=Sediminicurvatus halobius TaxID=2182432 RepID=A0A2U2N139_9GAMM|nr:exosortase A [Spiribacter halobius]PWG62684.1 exosortase A [Spiribacter halobius]UEX77353.1 exosortase A [Spiribacter halobius]
MSASTDHLPSAAVGEQRPYSWPLAGALAVGLIALTLALFFPTAWSMVEIWTRSETFAHGYIIAPISLFLIWRRREVLAQIAPRPQPLALVVLIGAGFLWLLSDLAEVAVTQQLALVSMIPAVVWLTLGTRVVWALLFPLAYLFFSVPIGEFLILPLMKLTADVTVSLVRLSGIPVFREGFFFSLPSGNWSIVEGCSGLRYLIASVALGTLYAYITYRSALRRSLFVVASVIVPIIANSLRAYMIVMIGHFSGMEYATGVDHLIYGWVFFGVVILLMFWVGAYWAEDTRGPAPGSLEPEPRRQGLATPFSVAGIGVLALAAWPALAYQLQGPPASAFSRAALQAPVVAGWSQSDGGLTEWSPRYRGMDLERHASYQGPAGEAGLYLAYYLPHAEQGELINSQNVMVEQKHPRWRMTTVSVRGDVPAAPGGSVYEADLRLEGQRVLAWYWYWIGGEHLTDRIQGKALEAFAPLMGRERGTAGVVVYAPYGTEREEARETLRAFLADARPALDDTLTSTVRGGQ